MEPSGSAGRDDDSRLLAAALRGDQRAFVDLLRRHDRMLRLVAWQVLGDRDLMDDALQEVALKAWRGLPGFRGEAALGTWLSRLAYNAGIDMLRRRRRELPLEEPVGRDSLWAGPADHADPADLVGDREALRAAFIALPVDQRLTVLLVDREGCDYETVAGILGVRPGTVASRLSRARSALRAALTPAAGPTATR